MAKDWDDKGYWGKQNSINDIGEQLGIDYQDYSDKQTKHTQHLSLIHI